MGWRELAVNDYYELHFVVVRAFQMIVVIVAKIIEL